MAVSEYERVRSDLENLISSTGSDSRSIHSRTGVDYRTVEGFINGTTIINTKTFVKLKAGIDSGKLERTLRNAPKKRASDDSNKGAGPLYRAMADVNETLKEILAILQDQATRPTKTSHQSEIFQ